MSIPFVELAGPSHNLQLFGVKLLGINAHNGHKLIITVVFFVLLYIISSLLRWFARIAGGRRNQMAAFWTRQGISLLTFIFGALGFMSIWFDNPTRLCRRSLHRLQDISSSCAETPSMSETGSPWAASAET
jgi:phosphatidylglycerophosphate synthase